MRKLTRRAEELLLEILNHRDKSGNCDSEYWQERFERLSGADDVIIRSLFKELKEAEMIEVHWADNYPYLLYVLGSGLEYFEENDKNNESTNTYTNYFYGPNTSVQIQQGCSNSSQTINAEQELDLNSIMELIDAVNKYDSILNQEYGQSSADELRKLISQLDSLVNGKRKQPGKIKTVLNYIRDLSVNAGGGLIATGILQIIENMR